MNEYVHKLGDDEQDDKKIRRPEEGAEKAVKALASKRFKKLCRSAIFEFCIFQTASPFQLADSSRFILL